MAQVPPQPPQTARPKDRASLVKFAWLSIAAALLTITLKTGAWWITGSVGLLSDAAESLVNLVAAIIALMALSASARPADHNHLFGHSKAEYLSAAAEGQLILVAAIGIGWASIARFFDPQPLQDVGTGLLVSVVASIVNGAVAWVLIRAGRKHRSITLVADGKHLLTDLWTSVGVVVGVGLVALTGYERLDAIVGFLVGLNIARTGARLLRDSIDGLMDHAWSQQETAELGRVLAPFVSADVAIHGIRTRAAGHARFADLHLLVPGEWTVRRSHQLADEIERQVARQLADVRLMCHVEPVEDPGSYSDFDAEADIWMPETGAE